MTYRNHAQFGRALIEGLREGLYLNIWTTHRTPFDQTALFSLVSIRTSGVLICFSANFLIAFIALGARFLKPLRERERERDLRNSFNLLNTLPLYSYYKVRESEEHPLGHKNIGGR